MRAASIAPIALAAFTACGSARSRSTSGQTAAETGPSAEVTAPSAPDCAEQTVGTEAWVMCVANRLASALTQHDLAALEIALPPGTWLSATAGLFEDPACVQRFGDDETVTATADESERPNQQELLACFMARYSGPSSVGRYLPATSAYPAGVTLHGPNASLLLTYRQERPTDVDFKVTPIPTGPADASTDRVEAFATSIAAGDLEGIKALLAPSVVSVSWFEEEACATAFKVGCPVAPARQRELARCVLAAAADFDRSSLALQPGNGVRAKLIAPDGKARLALELVPRSHQVTRVDVSAWIPYVPEDPGPMTGMGVIDCDP